MEAALDKLRFLVVGALIMLSLIFLGLLISNAVSIAGDSSSTSSRQSISAGNGSLISTLDSPNAVTASLTIIATSAGSALSSIGHASADVFMAIGRAIATTVSFVGRAIYTSIAFVARIIANSVSFISRAIYSSLTFVIRTPGRIVGSSTNLSVNSILQPSTNQTLPQITPIAYSSPPSSGKAKSSNQAALADSSTKSTSPIWPIHGRITTLYGVPHWPWQPTHSGIDISSSRAMGVTKVKPFRNGVVIDTMHSNHGLGNHVVVDHGSGMTSVYAHLYSISAKVGQRVTPNTTLGREGSTGASTGTHLHFEIRINGQPVNPQKYLTGRP